MPKLSYSLSYYPWPLAALLMALLLLSGCTPTLDWREVRGSDAPFTVLLPAKPAVRTRQIDLEGAKVMMTMTAADADGVTFAVASAPVASPDAVGPAMNAMKTALVRNIDGTVRKEQPSPTDYGPIQAVDIEAIGKREKKTGSEPLLMFARFAAKDQRIYQAVVIGPEKAVTKDAVDTFFTSFKLN
jgi:hypothetical protein